MPTRRLQVLAIPGALDQTEPPERPPHVPREQDRRDACQVSRDTFDAAGEPVRGERAINEVEADVVHRVFWDFASGVSPRTIAKRLNAESIPCPYGCSNHVIERELLEQPGHSPHRT